ncbi:hypothetical protein ASPZODRAFT_136910 [Penicilliopsis zonata CBS 506.65]|uniref:Beta-lactamase-related domain-containing protein n=1 Tax=Penicilliopsis zonata CBS 506.65 TaxID=1073090 RepID=A0A1L9S6I2_9EURO|nr:hypothetical protein ASPZODRAFT_136910 [Penicilliopsis zonata CBS 506.65]OJJ42768.1 hypothetical protein ASPZODRAFT_136910 [Penicilliopsis zonata CBS 506.65]
METTKIEEILETIAVRYRGPGGAVAVLQHGAVVGQRVWGWADMNERIALTAETQMPICSITKQFVCALLLDLYRNPTPAMAARGEDIPQQFSDQLKELLPALFRNTANSDKLTIETLCGMHSGLRDYWAMTTLWGAKPEDEFLVARDGPGAMARTRSLMFDTGTEYSYSNVNFYVVARAIERVTGEPLDQLLAERVLRPAGMKTAFLCPNTAHHPPPCVGYEGGEVAGYQAAVNRMEWAGDAGLVASLTDMIAWEKHLETLFADPDSWYRRTVYQPQTYADGITPAHYHYGMAHVDVEGVDSLGHGGALRGYRLHRRHAPSEHLSVVVLFNHEADASAAVDDILRAVLNRPTNSLATPTVTASADWAGVYLDGETQLAITVTQGSREGEIKIAYAAHNAPETIKLTDPHHGRSRSMHSRIDNDRLSIHRIIENRHLDARRLRLRDEDKSFTSHAALASIVGDYECADVDSVFHCFGEGAMLYGAFDGYLGRGPATPMRHLGEDVWALTCPRGLDAPPPGDWTVVLRRDPAGGVTGFTIGCWLARRLEFVKQ